MLPIVLHGHSRPIVRIKYNYDGDVLVSCSKDPFISVWSSSDGSLLGTYMGHSAMVWDFDFDRESRICLSGGADTSAQLWVLETGVMLKKYTCDASIRSLAISPCDQYALMVVEDRMNCKSSVLFVKLDIPNDLKLSKPLISDLDQVACSRINVEASMTPVLVARWSDSSIVYFAHENGSVSCWNSKQSQLIKCVKVASKSVLDLQFSADKTHFIIASFDRCARILNRDLDVLKVLVADAPINGAALFPCRYHVLLGGGQEANKVTTTGKVAGNFDAKFFHSILEQEFARLGGHFGPINAVAVHPDNLSFATGAEDGIIRLCRFDPDYFEFKLDPMDI